MLQHAGRRNDILTSSDFGRHSRKSVGERVVAAESLKDDEDKQIERDYRVVNEGRRLPVGVVVVERKYHGPVYPNTGMLRTLRTRYVQIVTPLLLNRLIPR